MQKLQTVLKLRILRRVTNKLKYKRNALSWYPYRVEALMPLMDVSFTVAYATYEIANKKLSKFPLDWLEFIKKIF